jgi:hypothetical protein
LPERTEIGKSRLRRSLRRLGAAEVVEHDRYRRGQHLLTDAADHAEVGEDLDVPVAACHARQRRLEALARHRGIVGAAGREIEADASQPRLAHGIEIGVGRLVVDHRDAAGIGAPRLHAVERRGIVGAVDAWRHDHHPLDLQGTMQRGHLLWQGHLGRVDTTGEKRKLLRVTMDVGVAVARIRRHVEIHRRRRLRCLGKARVGSRQGSSTYCADHCVASRQHGFLRSASSHPFAPP